jgi:hypothetical protein
MKTRVKMNVSTENIKTTKHSFLRTNIEHLGRKEPLVRKEHLVRIFASTNRFILQHKKYDAVPLEAFL